MHLELASYDVKDVVFSDEDGLVNGVLHVDKAALLDHLSKVSPFEAIELDIARPGESVRIIHTLDVVEPRAKAPGAGRVFPGLLGPPLGAGAGRTLRLNGVAVVGVAEPFTGEDHWAFREGVIEMSGPGAELCPFSKTVNLVVKFVQEKSGEEAGEKENFQVDAWDDEGERAIEATRLLTVRAAEYLARAAHEAAPDDVTSYDLTPANEDLPRVVYMHHNVGSSLYGWSDYSSDHAMLLHPNEIMDGVLVLSDRFVEPAIRDCTYFHQNNSIIEELYSRHGKDLNFAGVVFFTGHSATLEHKERESDNAVKLAHAVGADVAIVSPFRSGHSGVAFMMVCQKCERSGIKVAVGVSQLVAGAGEPGLNHWVPEADAMVVSGNDRETLKLPAVEKVIGGTELLNGLGRADVEVEIEVRNLYGLSAPMGPTRLSAGLY